MPWEAAAAKAMLDHIHANPLADASASANDTNSYVLGCLGGHNVVLAYSPAGVYGTTSAASIAMQMCTSFKSLRFSLIVGIGGGVPNTKEHIRLGDIVVGRPTAARPGLSWYDIERRSVEDQFTSTQASEKPSTLLLIAMGKTETSGVLGESQIPRYISEIVPKEGLIFDHPGSEQDVLLDPDYDHTTAKSEEDACN